MEFLSGEPHKPPCAASDCVASAFTLFSAAILSTTIFSEWGVVFLQGGHTAVIVRVVCA
jgi:hypothetical protein